MRLLSVLCCGVREDLSLYGNHPSDPKGSWGVGYAPAFKATAFAFSGIDSIAGRTFL